MELNTTKLLAAIDRAAAEKDTAAVTRLTKLLPNPAEAQPRSIDSSTGAGIGTRAVVGNARTPQDKLAAMRNHYPEAQPYGPEGGNFIFNSRETGQPTLYNPPGMMPELGDFAEYGRDITATLAGTAAGVIASPTTVGAVIPASAAAAGTGALYDAAVNEYFGGVDSRDVGSRTVDGAIEFATGLIPFEKALGPAKDFVVPRFRNMMTNANQAVIDVANKYNINATAGVLGSRFMQGLDAASQKVLGGVDAWEKSANEMMEGVGRMIDDFHVSLGGKSNPEAAGQRLINKAQKYFDNFQTTSEDMYKLVDTLIPQGARVPALSTRDFLSNYRDRFANDPAFQKILRDPTVGALADAAEDGMEDLGYKTLADLRTLIGGKIQDRDTIGDLSQSQMKQLYKALTEDIFAGAADFGDDALAAARNANDFYRAGSLVIEDVVEPNFMVGGKWATANTAFNQIRKQVNDPEKLRNIQASGVLEEGDFNQVGSAILEDVGAATRGGQNATNDRLSPGRIISQTDKSVIPEGSRDILFNGTSKEIMEDMRVFGEAVQGVEGLVNRSNTGNMLGAQASMVAGFTTDPLTAILTVVGSVAIPFAVSRGISSQWLKDWMRKAPKEASETAMAEWKASGMRIATTQGVAPFFQAMLDLSDENTSSSRGALEE